jgi:hypothetical protein
MPIQEGKIAGNQISFATTFDAGGNTIKILYKGTMSGDQIRMTREREGSGSRPDRLLFLFFLLVVSSLLLFFIIMSIWKCPRSGTGVHRRRSGEWFPSSCLGFLRWSSAAPAQTLG